MYDIESQREKEVRELQEAIDALKNSIQVELEPLLVFICKIILRIFEWFENKPKGSNVRP